MAKILILEDEEVLGRLYKKYLEHAGHEVMWKDTSKKAKDELLTFQPDIALIDHAIRGETVSGFDLLVELRKTMPGTKTIMLSNYGQADLKKKAFAAGADDFYIKLNTPPKVLVAKIKQILS